MENQLDRKDLKIQALLEKIGSLTGNYENQLADFRVEYTLLEQKYNELLGSFNEVNKVEEPQVPNQLKSGDESVLEVPTEEASEDIYKN